ncbi:MAG TPA: cytochrome c biogenesis heme-transporting ATPase CcmA [Burkholderiales bacterium]
MLEAADLRCERGGRVLFERLSFRLGAGEFLRVSGANGSGKTSLLRVLCGLLTPSRGSVRWKGEPVAALREEYARQLVYLGHAPAVKGDLTAEENLSIACTLAGVAASRDAVKSALARFALPDDVPVRRLSQGQRRRAALARLALSGGVPLWLLDEPFAALDAEGIERLGALLSGHAEKGGAIVFTTHQDPGFAATRTLELA